MIKTNIDSSKGRIPPSWLALEDDELEGRVLQLPNRDEVSVSIQEQLVVELCYKINSIAVFKLIKYKSAQLIYEILP